MKIQSFASLLVAGLALLHSAHAQVPRLEQKTAFCATSVDLFRKRDNMDLYLCQTSEHTCGPYLKPSCLDEAKQGGWDVASGTPQTLIKDYASTPCKCVGTQYLLTRKAVPAVPAPVTTPAAATTAATATAAVATVAAVPAANAAARSLATEVEGLQQDNLLIKRQLEQLQRQVDELRRSLPAAK